MADWQPYPSWSTFQSSQNGNGTNSNNPSFWPPSSAFRNLVHAFPKSRRASRVSKPNNSVGNSPSSSSSSAGRRRTVTSAAPPMAQGSSVRSRAPMDSSFLATSVRSGRGSRPVSWHPAGNNTPTTTNTHTAARASQYFPPLPSSSSSTTTAAMDLSAMALPPSLNDTTPLYSDNTNMLSPFPFSGIPSSDDTTFLTPTSTSFLPVDNSSPVEQSAAWDGGLNVNDMSTIPPPSLTDGWPFDMMLLNDNIPSMGDTSPSTPDLLPFQAPEYSSESQSEPDLTSLKNADDEDELVGMGLYNQPESIQSLGQGMLGKGLKLEETFTPSMEQDKEAEDENDDDDDDENENENEDSNGNGNGNDDCTIKQEPDLSEPIKQPVKPAMNMLSQPFLFNHDDGSFDQTALTDSQLLFNLNALDSLNQPCVGYGYGWV